MVQEENKIKSYIVTKESSPNRLDKWLLNAFPNLNNSVIQKLIRTGQIRVNSKRYKFTQEVVAGDSIRVPLFIIKEIVSKPVKISHKIDTNLYQKEIDEIVGSVIYQNDDILAINKPSGIAVQGGTKVGFNLSYAFEKLAFEKNSLPHIVHRIDKDTSGILLLARTKVASQYISKLFQEKKIEKKYWCLVYPFIRDIPRAGCIQAPLMKVGGESNQRIVIDEEGREAITYYSVKEVFKNDVALLEVRPVTGRTHQIRVHLSSVLNTPIVGDYKYGFKKYDLKLHNRRVYLHAKEIRFQDASAKEILIDCPAWDNFIKGTP